MKYYLILLIALPGLFSCNNTAKRQEARTEHIDSLRDELLQTDIAFSQMSEDKGRNAAFIEYAADDATMLRPFSMPVTGKDTITSFFRSRPDSSRALTWMPIHADVARSGDIGYTYGTYTLALYDIGEEDGTYCIIWKREKGKPWKFVVASSNEGLKPADREADKWMDIDKKKEMQKEKKK